jgi:hypothetical protein
VLVSTSLKRSCAATNHAHDKQLTHGNSSEPILDRPLQSAEVILFKGRSYRLHNKTANQPETSIDNPEKKGDL